MPDDPTFDLKDGGPDDSSHSVDTASSDRPAAGQGAARFAHWISATREGTVGVQRHALTPLNELRQLLGRRSPAQVAGGLAVLAFLGLGATATIGDQATDRPGPAQAARSAAELEASRSMNREPIGAAAPGDASAGTPGGGRATPAAASPATSSAGPAPAKTKKLPPGHLDSRPVAGLTDVQMNNAKAIVWTGVDMKLPRRALVIAVATAMQESELLNRASEVLPESKQYPHQGTGWDYDSVGLFQQRTSTGWGPVGKLMDPAYASQQFYYALMQVPGWQYMQLAEAAQAVQVSAFPDHYARHEGRAQQVVNALTDVN